MDRPSLEDRFGILERTVSDLVGLPAGFLQLRADVSELRSEFDQFRGEALERFDEIGRRFEAVDRRFDGVDQRIDGVELELRQFQDVVVSNFDETRRLMRVLYEDLVSRIAAIGEGGL